MAARLTKISLIFAIIFLLSPLFGHASAYAQTATDLTPPEVGAKEAIVVEYPSGRVLYAKDEHEQMAPASLTKIMTAILALEYGNLNDVVTISPDDIVGESTMGLVSGEHQTLQNLLYGMMLPSGNDAAMAIARHLGSTIGASVKSDSNDPIVRFAAMMNTRVTQLGLQDTHFLTPHGLDQVGHYSSAYDLASLSWYALHIPQFNQIVSQTYYDAGGHDVQNTNEMLTRYAGSDGIKTGWTDGCGLCLITSATRDGHRLISVVLNDDNWWNDSASILDYGFATLAAKPTDPSADVLAVSMSGVVSSILADPASVMPVPPQMAQGGGASAASSAPEVVQPVVTDNKLAPVQAPAQPANLATTSNTQPIVQSSSNPGILWLLAFVAIALVGMFLAARALGWKIKFGKSSAPFEPAAVPMPMPADDHFFKPLPKAVARTLGTETVPATRRREPNLLMRPEDTFFLHIERGVSLAEEGKQGSSMSEFLSALRAGGPIDISILAEEFQLSATAFLALARAQYTSNQAADARRTLLHGILVLPHERMLRLALHHMPEEEV